jgi:hypothetical protein
MMKNNKQTKVDKSQVVVQLPEDLQAKYRLTPVLPFSPIYCFGRHFDFEKLTESEAERLVMEGSPYIEKIQNEDVNLGSQE